MAERSVLVRLIADNRSFDAAMVASGQRVKDVGTEATLAGNVGTQAFSRLRTAAVTFLGVGLLSAGQNMINLKQQAQIAFTSITGDAQKASAQIQQIYEWDQKVPVPFQNALAAGQKLAAFGLNMRDIVPTLGAIADATGAVGGTADTFDRIALAIGQIQTKGKLSAEEMLQLAESGLPAWQLLADQLGVSIPQAMKETQRGTIDANTAIEALRKGIEERFPGAAEKMKETTAGAFQALQAGARNAAESILAPLQQTEQQGFLTGKALLEAAGAGIGATLQGTMSAFSLLNGLLGVTEDTSKGISPVMSAVGVAMLGTHLGAQRLESGWASLKSTAETLALRTMYMSDAVKASGSAMGITRLAVTSLGAAAVATGRGMLAAFGGPLGIAIIGVTTAMAIWGDAQQDAQKKEADHEAQLSSLKDTIDRVSGAFTAATTAKINQDWISDGTTQRMKDLGVNTTLALQAAAEGGPKLDAFRQQLAGLATEAIKGSDVWQRTQVTMNSLGISAEDLGVQVANGARSFSIFTGTTAQDATDLAAVVDQFGQIGQTVGGTQSLVTEGSKDWRDAFVEMAKVAADAAGVSSDVLIPALDGAKESGRNVMDALAAVGIEGDQASTVISNLGEFVRDAGGGMYYMAGAASEAGSAIAAAADDGDKMTDAMKRLANSTVAALNNALAFRQGVSSSLTGFVDPMGAWEAAVDAANPSKSGGGRKKSRKTPAELAAEAALKAGRIQADATKKSAKAERDAAIKAAAKIRDATKARADADLKATRAAEKNARDRVTAAKKEADDLKRIADDAAKQATDAQSRLEAAQFAKRAADIALQAAQAGLASAKSPEERASWERAVANALADQATATANLTTAQQTATATTQAATDAKNASEAATTAQTQAESDYAAAQDHTAQVSETTSARKTAADNTYTSAKEKADTRYQKSVDAVNSKLDALTKKQDDARDSAQKMADGASSAVGGMTKKITPSLQQFMGELEKQVKAQQTWRDNLVALADKLPDDVSAGLALAGPKLAPVVAGLRTATQPELDKFAAMFRLSTEQGVRDSQNTIIRAIIPAGNNMALLSDGMIAAFIDQFTTAKTTADAQKAFRDLQHKMQAEADKNKLTIDLGITSDNADSWLRTWMQKKTSAIGSTFGSMTTGNIRVGGKGQYASGGSVDDGWFTVGERGWELGYKSGSDVRIFPHGQSQSMIPAPAPSGPQITIVQNNVINYPQGTPPAVATNRELASAAALGGLG